MTSAVEHHAVGHTLRYLEKFGFEVVELPVDRYGRVDPDQLEAALTDRTILVSIMLANNEVGTLQPVADIAKVGSARTRRVLFHVDAVQAAPYVDLDVGALDADLVSLGAHKFEGPKGVGALYVRHGTHILAQQQGGTQERHRRAGTENVAGAVGLAAAYDLTCAERSETVGRLRRAARATRARRSSPRPARRPPAIRSERLPGLLSIIARDTDGASVAMSLDLEGIACSVGSACTTGSTEVSHVLTAMGYPEEEARGALRLSLGRTTTDEEMRPRRARSCRGSSPRCRSARGAVAADPLGQGIGGMSRILVAMSGGVDSSVAAALAPRAGPRGRRRVDAPARRRRHVLRVQEELLLARRGRRRPPGRRAARHPVLRHEPRARVRRGGPRSRSSTRTSTGATPSPCVDCNTYVKFGALLGRARHLYDCEAVATGHYARRVVGDDGRARLLRARDEDKDQTYFLYGLRDRPARARPVPARRADQARGAGGRALARARDGGQAREPGDLLRARRRLPRRAARAGRLGAAGRPAARRRRDAGRRARRVGRPTPWASARASASRSGEPRYVSRIDPRSNTIQLGRREDLETHDVHDRAGLVRRAGRAARRRSVPLSASATAPRSIPATSRPLGDKRWADRRPTRRSGRPRPARPPSCTTARRSSAAAASSARSGRPTPRRPHPAARGAAFAGPRRAARSGVSLEPSLVLSVLVGHLPRRPVGAPSAAAPAVGCRSLIAAAILGAWAGDAIFGRLGIDVLTIGDYHLLGASIVAWVGIGLVSVVAVLGPTAERRA